MNLALRIRDECEAAITWLARELDFEAQAHGPVTAQQAAARRKTTILGLNRMALRTRMALR